MKIAAAIIFASCLLLLAVSLACAQTVRVGGAGDYLSSGAANFTGESAHAGYWGPEMAAGGPGVEVGYRHFSGHGVIASGPTADLYWRWENYFVTGGVDYTNVNVGRFEPGPANCLYPAGDFIKDYFDALHGHTPQHPCMSVPAGTASPGVDSRDFNWRVGAGLQFGWFRASLRYEPFHSSNGLTLGVGLDVPVWP